MKNDPGGDLRDRFRATPLPPAPVRLHDRLAAVATSPVATTTSRFGRARLVVALAAVVGVASIGLLVGGGTDEPSPSPDGGPWGPLAVANLMAADAALTHGELLFTDHCAFLVEGDGTRVLLVWPAARTTWDAEARMVRLKHLQTNDVVSLRQGIPLELGGGGSSVSEDGLTGEAWATRFDWVAPPATECLTDERWVISDVVPLTSEATPDVPSYPITCEEASQGLMTCAGIVNAVLEYQAAALDPESIVEIVVTRHCLEPCDPATEGANVSVVLGPPTINTLSFSVRASPGGPTVLAVMTSERALNPSYGGEPPPGSAIAIDAVALFQARDTLRIRIFANTCVETYNAWIGGSGDRLRVAIIVAPEDEPRPSSAPCEVYRLTYVMNLAEPFQGTIVEDVSNGQIFEVDPA